MIREDRIARAAEAIDPVFRNTPQFHSKGLSAMLGCHLLCKVESINPIGSFKGRGVDWWARQQEIGQRITCASAGNFGQALAYVGRRLGIEVDVFAAETANAVKVEAMRSLGATVRLHGRDFDEAKIEAERFAKAESSSYIEDGLVDDIAEGAGTMAIELLRDLQPIDEIYIPVGNGALVNGVGAWFRHHSRDTRIIGVCAEGAPSMERSWRLGEAVETDTVDTIADGVAARVPIPRSLEHLADSVDDIVLVSDDDIVRAMRAYWQHENLVAEPAGAVSLAGAMASESNDRRIATILTGSNIDPARRSEWLG